MAPLNEIKFNDNLKERRIIIIIDVDYRRVKLLTGP